MKISIITVCLNSEKTIGQTIQSVISQNDEDLEYIIIDGKSGDKTCDIIARYRSHISKVVSEPDDGVYAAMNKGIALATGDVIGIINSDDWYEPGTFRNVRKCFQESDAEVVYGNLNMVAGDEPAGTFTAGNIERLRYEMETPHPTVFVKKGVYERHGGFQLKYKIAADYELMLRLYINGAKFTYLDVTLANYRIGGISLQQGKMCADETYAISKNYLPYAPPKARAHIENIIEYKRNLFYFGEMMRDFPNNLLKVLKGQEPGFKDSIAIFGAGKWGIKAYGALVQKGIRPLFFVDNDSERRKGQVRGVEVLPPERLASFKGVLLIMVKDSSSEVLHQMENLHNPQLRCITWDEIACDFMSIWEDGYGLADGDSGLEA